MPKLNKKGQTLVEVTVALGILAIVFAGTVTLIVQVVNLELSARNRTEAVALAQKYLAESIQSTSCGCSKDISSLTFDEDLTPDDNYDVRLYCNLVNDNLTDREDNCSAISGNFIKIKATVGWSDKGLPSEIYELSQITKVK